MFKKTDDVSGQFTDRTEVKGDYIVLEGKGKSLHTKEIHRQQTNRRSPLQVSQNT